jgi:RNA polymerase sigma-70 factor (ECF subfamily)
LSFAKAIDFNAGYSRLGPVGFYLTGNLQPLILWFYPYSEVVPTDWGISLVRKIGINPYPGYFVKFNRKLNYLISSGNAYALFSILVSLDYKYQGLNEIELIRGCQKMDAAAQLGLFREYAGKLMTICRRYACDSPEAEDILQEAFINIFGNIKQYKSKGSFEGWLKRITVNCALKVLQSRKIRFNEISISQHATASATPDVYSDLSAEDLLKYISQLPDGYRVIFNLYVLEGYSHEEIAHMLHIKTATSRSQLSKARAVLQEKINLSQKIPG